MIKELKIESKSMIWRFYLMMIVLRSKNYVRKRIRYRKKQWLIEEAIVLFGLRLILNPKLMMMMMSNWAWLCDCLEWMKPELKSKCRCEQVYYELGTECRRYGFRVTWFFHVFFHSYLTSLLILTMFLISPRFTSGIY